MNKRFLFSLILGALPLMMMAQDDDMYFVPTKKNVEKEAVNYGMPRSTYYSGINSSVDEYNRRGGSYYQVLPTDTTGDDRINFSAERGVYPDSTAAAEDFALTKKMTRYDGYEPENADWEGYRDGRDAYRWHSPWYYSSYYPWYDSYWYWNDPWYYHHYGWYSSWYDPWYYDYYWYRPYGWYGGYHYGYYRPYYYGGSYTVSNSKARYYDRIVSSSPRGISNGRQTVHSAGTFGGSAVRNSVSNTRNSNVVQRTPNVTTNNYGNFGGTRNWNNSSSSSSGSFGGTVSRGSSGGSFSSGGGGGGSFGGSRSVGGSRSSRR